MNDDGISGIYRRLNPELEVVRARLAASARGENQLDITSFCEADRTAALSNYPLDQWEGSPDDLRLSIWTSHLGGFLNCTLGDVRVAHQAAARATEQMQLVQIKQFYEAERREAELNAERQLASIAPKQRLISPKDTAARLGVSVRTLQRMVKRGGCPAPAKVSTGRIGFFEHEVETWLSGLPRSPAERSGEAAPTPASGPGTSSNRTHP